MENTSNILNVPKLPEAQVEQLLVGHFSVRNWEPARQDTHTCILSLKDDPAASYFGIFDGHGGDSVAQYAAKHLHEIIVQQLECEADNDIEKVLKQSFLDVDAEILHNESSNWKSYVGSTAVTLLIKEYKVYCAHVGNCRALASIGGKPELLSVENNPMAATPRLCRVLGDFELKPPNKNSMGEIFTAYPVVDSFELTENWEFVIMGCEALWEAMGEKDILQFCRLRIGQGMQPMDICFELVNNCLQHEGISQLAGDLTVILVCLLHGKPYNNLVARCQLKAEENVDSVPDPELEVQ